MAGLKMTTNTGTKHTGRTVRSITTDIQAMSEGRITENMNMIESMRSIPQADTSAKTNPSIDLVLQIVFIGLLFTSEVFDSKNMPQSL